MAVVRPLCLALMTLTLALAAINAAAEAPWQKLNLFKSVEADPNNRYTLAADNGPWMIMAATFAGDGADAQATELVLELRKRYGLEAYAHKMSFDYTKPVEGRGLDKYGNTKKMVHLRYVPQETADGKVVEPSIDEIAVLVGNYASIDDSKARKDLEKIKHADPETLKPKKERQTSQQLAWWRAYHKVLLRPDSDKKHKGPMGHAFITANPHVSANFFKPRGIDKFVQQMNAGVENSLLDCRGRFTVQVATFSGRVVIDQKKIQRIETGGESFKSRLGEAAEKAHMVCQALRAKGYEAYEFHDRQSSMVTVGSFDSVGTPRSDGKLEIHPTVHKIMQTFAADAKDVPTTMASVGGRPGVGRHPKTVSGIPLDLQPIPVEVPRRSYAADYSRKQ